MASQCGAIKRLKHFPGIVVDGFNYQSPDVRAYVLTHYHADHYCGLSSSFNKIYLQAKDDDGEGDDGEETPNTTSVSSSSHAPLIYCTTITARLLVHVLGVNARWVRGVELGVAARVLDDVEVTFIDANHCPGAAIVFMRRLDTSATLLHTGDFRAARCVREDETLKRLTREACVDGCVDELMLDTTYCDNKWTFPDQAVVLDKMRTIAAREIKHEPRTLFLCGSYSIGKERAIRAVCQGAGSRASVTQRRKRSLVLSDWWSDDLFVGEEDDPLGAAECKVRVVGLGRGSNHRGMMEILKNEAPRWNAVVAFAPTGWSWTKKMETDEGFDVNPWVENDGRTRTYSVPYSEHSSYTELREFVKFLKPKKITPTVNAATRKERDKLVNKHFLDLVDLKQDSSKLDFYFKNKVSAAPSKTPKENSNDVIVIESENEDEDAEVKVEAEVLSALNGDVETVRRQRELWKRFQMQNSTQKAPKGPEPLEPFPLECIAVVRSGEYTQFRSRAHVEQRLEELGATVMSRVTSNVTHIIVPGKGELANEANRLNALRQQDEYRDHPSALRVTEGWVMRHVRARANNVAPEHSEMQLKAFEEKKKLEKAARLAAAKRKREEKKMNDVTVP
mmetsp:Transcript_3327/g.11114  ORF Transcript_3327/g.11114 Transcript_3327/m.11114 type:complete len:620 (+) Transcript_3327:49-1908(+)